MKKQAQIIILLLLSFFTASAQDSPYQKAMKKEIAKLTSTDSLPVLQQSANAFGRIAELNPGEWLPVYYQGLAYTFQAMDKSLSLDKKDEALAKADELAQKADALSKNNAEVIALQGFVLMAKLNADATNRGQSLSGPVLQTFGKARSMDPKNPRAFALTAQMEYGMAKFFGSGTEKACGYAKEVWLYLLHRTRRRSKPHSCRPGAKAWPNKWSKAANSEHSNLITLSDTNHS